MPARPTVAERRPTSPGSPASAHLHLMLVSQAGHASLPYPDATHLALWHSLTLLREFRGDGHIAALVAEGNDGCDAMVMHRATGEIPQNYADSRGWSAEEWAASQDGLRGRGWLDAEGSLTDAGRASRQWVEDRTDDLALLAWKRLSDDEAKRLRDLMRPLTKAIAAEAFQVFQSTNAIPT